MDKITLNVGGKKCETLKSTLMKMPYFKTYFESWDHDQEIFLDLDFKIFTHVLNKMRDPNYFYPDDEILTNNINNMFDYFGFITIKSYERKNIDVSIYCSTTQNSYYGDSRLNSLDGTRFTIIDLILKIDPSEFSGFEIKSEGTYIMKIQEPQLFLFFKLFNTDRQFKYFKLKKNFIEKLADLTQLDFHIYGNDCNVDFCYVHKNNNN